jgi:hypothetical protein
MFFLEPAMGKTTERIDSIFGENLIINEKKKTHTAQYQIFTTTIHASEFHYRSF